MGLEERRAKRMDNHAANIFHFGALRGPSEPPESKAKSDLDPESDHAALERLLNPTDGLKWYTCHVQWAHSGTGRSTEVRVGVLAKDPIEAWDILKTKNGWKKHRTIPVIREVQESDRLRDGILSAWVKKKLTPQQIQAAGLFIWPKDF